MAKEMKYGYSGITVQAETEGIAMLVSIFNDECERIVNYWLTDEDWAHGFEHHKEEHWMIADQQGLARAMYFMDMLDDVEQSRAVYIYNFCKAEVERRKHESDN